MQNAFQEMHFVSSQRRCRSNNLKPLRVHPIHFHTFFKFTTDSLVVVLTYTNIKRSWLACWDDRLRWPPTTRRARVDRRWAHPEVLQEQTIPFLRGRNEQGYENWYPWRRQTVQISYSVVRRDKIRFCYIWYASHTLFSVGMPERGCWDGLRQY